MATAEQIRQWVQANPLASTEQIQQAMAANNVSPQEVAAAIGATPIQQMPVEVRQQQYIDQVQNNAGNPWYNNVNKAGVAAQLGLGQQELQAIDPNAQQVLSTVYRSDQIQPGTVTPDQIRSYLAGNRNLSEKDIALKMQEYGVTPQQFAAATGLSPAVVQDKYTQAVAETTPTGLAGYKQEITQGLGQATTTLQNTLEDISKQYGLNIQDLQNAATQARQDISGGYNQALGYLSPYQQGGEKAYQQQLALSGALGQEAFKAARQQSPYEQFLFEQGMRANLAGAAATGGLGGGNVQKELQRFGQGLASQGLQQQIGNLGALSGMGQQAATNMGNLSTGLGTALGNLGMNTAQNVASQRGQLAGVMGNTGTNIANIQYGTGQGIANQAMNVGNQLAAQQQAAAQLQAQYLNNQGLALQGLIANQGANVTNLGQSAYDQQIQSMIQQAQQQANLYSGQQYVQAPPTNYSGMISGALNAAGTGYNLGQMMGGQTTGVNSRYNTNPGYGPSYVGTYQQPSYGTVLGGIPGIQPINYLQPLTNLP